MDGELDTKLANAVVGEKKVRAAMTTAASTAKLTGKKAKSLRHRK
jgi:hypothetical protein